MELSDLINNGWARHDKESEALASDLEAHANLADDPAKAVTLLALSNHTIGYHLGDWPRALALAERVAAPLAPDAASSPVLGSLALARYMAGHFTAALAAECRAVQLAAEPLSAMIRTRILIASELADAARLPEAAALYTAALDLARSREEKLGCDRAIAVTSNNLASNLLEKSERSPREDELMLQAAQAAREFWLKAGNWENEERAEYLLALVLHALQRHQEALSHVARGLEVISANGEEVVDEAFLNLAGARASRSLGDDAAFKRWLDRADELATEFRDQSLQEWFASERAKVIPS